MNKNQKAHQLHQQQQQQHSQQHNQQQQQYNQQQHQQQQLQQQYNQQQQHTPPTSQPAQLQQQQVPPPLIPQQSQQSTPVVPQLNFLVPSNQAIISNIKLHSTFETLLLSLSSTDTREQIKSIIYFSSLVINNKLNGVDLVYCISKQLVIEPNNHIKVLLVNLLGDISLDPFIDSLSILNKLLYLIKNEKSKKVLSSCLLNLNKINKSLIGSSGEGDDDDLVCQIIEMIEPLLHSTCPLVRRETIVLLGSMVKNLDKESESIQILLLNYLQDVDYRVREASLKSLSIIFQRGASLSVNRLYQSIILLLLDSFEQVRLECIKLIWIFGNVYPNHIIQTSSNAKIRLVDDVFKKICNAVNDSSVIVRNCACKLLGCIYDVSLHHLIQTLSKEVMVYGAKGKQYQIGHSKITKQIRIQQQQQKQSGGNSSGSGSTNDSSKDDQSATHITTPEGDIDVIGSDSLNILESGVIGAFIQGLEDEFHEVRSSAIDSMCELSVRNDEFAQKNIDFLVDIFNDEIEAVRINSINSLRKIGNNVVIKEDQLHVILANLESSSKEERQSLHRLLSCIHLSNYSCLHATTQALLINLSRYPYDIHSIFDTFKTIGQINPFTEFIVDDLLRIDPKFASVEPNMDDIFYVAVMVLVLNSCNKNQNIISLLPSFCFQHHLYFKDKYPNYFPQNLKNSNNNQQPKQSQLPKHQTLSNNNEIIQFLNSTLSLLYGSNSGNGGFQSLFLNQRKEVQLNLLFQECKRNFKRISSISNSLKPTSDFYKKYLKIISTINNYNNNINNNNGASNISNLLNSLICKLKYTFIGVDNNCTLILIEIELFSMVIEILSTTTSSSSSSGSNTPDLSKDQIDQISNKLKRIVNFTIGNNLKISNSIQQLLKLFKIDGSQEECSNGNSGERSNKIQKVLILSSLMEWVKNYVPPVLKILNLVKKKSANVILPIPNDKVTIEFLDCYPLKLQINATIENIRNLDILFIQSTWQSVNSGYLNSTTHSISKSSFTPTKPLSYNVSCTIHLSLPNIRHNRLTPKESIPLRISIVEQLPQPSSPHHSNLLLPLSKQVIFNILPVDSVTITPSII